MTFRKSALSSRSSTGIMALYWVLALLLLRCSAAPDTGEDAGKDLRRHNSQDHRLHPMDNGRLSGSSTADDDDDDDSFLEEIIDLDGDDDEDNSSVFVEDAGTNESETISIEDDQVEPAPSKIFRPEGPVRPDRLAGQWSPPASARSKVKRSAAFEGSGDGGAYYEDDDDNNEDGGAGRGREDDVDDGDDYYDGAKKNPLHLSTAAPPGDLQPAVGPEGDLQQVPVVATTESLLDPSFTQVQSQDAARVSPLPVFTPVAGPAGILTTPSFPDVDRGTVFPDQPSPSRTNFLTSSPPAPPKDAPDKMGSPVQRGSGSPLYDDSDDGSGFERYDPALSSVSPSRPSGGSPPMSSLHSPGFPGLASSPFFDSSGGDPVVSVTDRVANRKPYLQKKLKKYPVTAGRSVRIVIPEETFVDPEEGTTRKLRLQLKFENGSLVRNTWLRFDEAKQTIYALPVNENDIGRWRFLLTAIDSEGESVSDTLEIMVRQYPSSRLVNHQFNIEFAFKDWDPATTWAWEWVMLDRLQRFYGDRQQTIVVRKVATNPYVFGWANDTLSQQNCPKEEIRKLFNALVEHTGDGASSKNSLSGRPSRMLTSILGDKVLVSSVSMSYHGTCLYDNSGVSGSSPDFGSDDSVPVMRNPIDRINVTAGELLRFKVPKDTCYDKEDGSTERLNLNLLTTSRHELSPDAWLQFDTRNQEFIGIPLEEEVGRTEYQLVCSDRKGLSAIDGIEVIVHNRPFSERFGVEFAFTFDDYSGMKSMKVRIVETIAAYFGDDSPSMVVLKTFNTLDNRVVWYNKSLAYLPCEHEAIDWIRDQLVDREGRVRRGLVEAFRPYQQLLEAEVIKRGACAIGAVPGPPGSGGSDSGTGPGMGLDPGLTMGPGGRSPTGQKGSGPSSMDHNHHSTIFHGIMPSADYLLTFIIPAVIITCMLILAILLACILHKKRKAGKLNLFYSSEAMPPRVPVILQDELYDENNQQMRQQQQAEVKQLMPPGLLVPDGSNGGGSGTSTLHRQQQQEMERLLQRPVAPISIDPFTRNSTLSRPTPVYQRRQI